MEQYSLYIRRYRRYQNFDTLDELREETRKYFTASEIAEGVVDRLTNFDSRKADEGGYIRNTYQDFETYYYPEENN